MATRKSTKSSTRDDAIVALMDWAVTQPTSAAIGDGLKVSSKTVRGRVRAATLKTPEGTSLPSVHVQREGQSALTDAHKRAIAYTFAPADEAACIALAASLAPSTK